MTSVLRPRQPKYVIVTPVRDEEQFIHETIRSVLSQTIQPAEWIIVDDGSRDQTGYLIDECAKSHTWIKALHRRDRGQRLPGTGVMEAFYLGYECLSSPDWDFIVKLDGDVGLPVDYFERCFQRFSEDSSLGMCGGVMYRLDDGAPKLESHPLMHVRGPIKLYSRPCWDAIGGLIRAPGWDTVDEIQANRRGWHTRSFPDLKVIHYRPTGAAQGAWKNSVKNGRADYISGYHPIFMAAKCGRRLFEKPYFVVGVGQAYGYLTGYLRRIPQVDDPGLIRYLRRQQMRRMFRMASIWK
jgi:glycosyltransferase involved in cell wall biosynthesis